ncbi:DUF4396 domain-containing protein [Streptomyces albipurpureus]|uniref:DUF4396 domain-containing protein n=1 Tax=Streptomyces albipurpureus TaxID=2897419 RepID=A0ABT0UWX4_9ACTN|nr:DUF4396 domain-containing protein [Streptomyces sp. CWNU-1]MCM2392439.1 DUF4396 domain-containing protein [Streptomyces sp. CWNU-1]
MQHDAHAHGAGHGQSPDGTSHEHGSHDAHTAAGSPATDPGHQGHDQHQGEAAHQGHGSGSVSWSMAARATLHCLIGCAIGEVLGMMIGTALGWHNVPTMALAIFLAFIFGYSFTMITILRAGLSFRAAVKVALAADTISILVMEITDNSVLALWPGALHAQLSDGLFWYALAIAFAVAFVITTPVNKWLIGRGKGHAVMHQFH